MLAAMRHRGPNDETNHTLIRHTRMTPLYADGLEEVEPSATLVSKRSGGTL